MKAKITIELVQTNPLDNEYVVERLTNTLTPSVGRQMSAKAVENLIIETTRAGGTVKVSRGKGR
jgi:hypothetical protein